MGMRKEKINTLIDGTGAALGSGESQASVHSDVSVALAKISSNRFSTSDQWNSSHCNMERNDFFVQKKRRKKSLKRKKIVVRCGKRTLLGPQDEGNPSRVLSKISSSAAAERIVWMKVFVSAGWKKAEQEKEEKKHWNIRREKHILHSHRQSINQSTNQAINQPIHQPIHQSINQSINRPH